MKKIILFLFLPLQIFAQQFSQKEISRWQSESKNVTIIRDNWGIPHVYGKTDADCVFGIMYAQCEDDFLRVEMNYIEKLGRLSEVNGEKNLYDDLLIRLVIDSSDAIKDYKNSPPWLHKLLDAFADGINYYLYKKSSVKPALLQHFEPWYALLWTDGSIGAINTAGISVQEIKNFYSGNKETTKIISAPAEKMQTGSNGFAIAPSKTQSHNAILYINPHVTFYFRPEVQMTSDDGLDAYGAITWGQFFVYQGFNEHCGWMHTSSAVDDADLYAEKISKKKDSLFYKYDNSLKPITQKLIVLKYKSGDSIQSKIITAYFTHHGPIITERNGQWLALKANNRDMNGLIQSWQRTKANSFAAFKKTMDIRANATNNTVYADAEGNIAYWHGNFIPKRDKNFNWSKPVDGSTSATEWKGLHKVDETVHIYNPLNGWIQNCNSTPFTAAGNNSPKRENYPTYMAPDGENFRSINAVRVLSGESVFTIDKIIADGYNTHLSAFEILLPALFKAVENLKADSNYLHLQEPINVLKNWDMNSSETSVATTLAVSWGEKIMPFILGSVSEDDDVYDQVEMFKYFVNTATSEKLTQLFIQTINELKNKYGDWKIAWGEISRYQRLAAFPNEKFDDGKASIPVGRTSSRWGEIPAFESRTFNTIKRYGTSGNSFICAVEFGKRIKAKSLLTGGESGDSTSPHFTDQALMYAKGQFKDVLFYKEDVLKHAEKTYHPGE
ncbi:MAG: penicillin acylase family protein [Chitinophagaceae bacterium]